MKTNVVMIRPMGKFEVKQRTKDGFFNATVILKQWQLATGSQKQLDHYFANKSTQELIDRYVDRKNLQSRDYVYVKSKASRGENAGTWMHPILFIDFAMWVNVDFKIDVLEMVQDQLIQFRKDSGDSYRKMCDALYPNFTDGKAFTRFITKEAAKIKNACNVKDWETATEEQLLKRKKIEETAIILSDVVSINSVIDLAIKKCYPEYYSLPLTY